MKFSQNLQNWIRLFISSNWHLIAIAGSTILQKPFGNQTLNLNQNHIKNHFSLRLDQTVFYISSEVGKKMVSNWHLIARSTIAEILLPEKSISELIHSPY